MPNSIRSEIVLVDFAAPWGTRPALIVQNDRDNERLGNTIVAQITTNISRSHLNTQLLIDPTHPDWERSGLKKPSVVICSNLATIRQADIRRTMGSLSPETMLKIDAGLRSALDLHE